MLNYCFTIMTAMHGVFTVLSSSLDRLAQCRMLNPTIMIIYLRLLTSNTSTRINFSHQWETFLPLLASIAPT